MYQVPTSPVFDLETEQRVFTQLYESGLSEYEYLIGKGVLKGSATKLRKSDPDRKLIKAYLEDHKAKKLRKIVAESQRLTHLITNSNIKLVITRANRFFSNFLDSEDLVPFGVIGLMKAIPRYDLERGFRFATYAGHWIDALIRRAIGDNDTTVRYPARNKKRPPRVQMVELEYVDWEGEVVEAGDHIMLDWDKAKGALDELSVRDRMVLRRRYEGDSESLESIGNDLGISRERVRQIQNKSLAFIRSKIEECA